MRKGLLLGGFVVLGLVAGVRGSEAGCVTDLGHCFEEASTIDSFWYRLAAGLDCELDFVECTREKLIGG